MLPYSIDENEWYSYKNEMARKIAYNIARRMKSLLGVKILRTERARSQKMLSRC